MAQRPITKAQNTKDTGTLTDNVKTTNKFIFTSDSAHVLNGLSSVVLTAVLLQLSGRDT
jgi:hypothetical protein